MSKWWVVEVWPSHFQTIFFLYIYDILETHYKFFINTLPNRPFVGQIHQPMKTTMEQEHGRSRSMAVAGLSSTTCKTILSEDCSKVFLDNCILLSIGPILAIGAVLKSSFSVICYLFLCTTHIQFYITEEHYQSWFFFCPNSLNKEYYSLHY